MSDIGSDPQSGQRTSEGSHTSESSQGSQSSQSSQIAELLEVISEAAEETGRFSPDLRVPLDQIFVDSIKKADHTISRGVDPFDFVDLTIVNFMTAADSAQYSTAEISSYLDGLKEA